MCHKSKYMISCDEALELNPLEAEIETTIDIDDSGPLEPFDATCVFQRMILSAVYHQCRMKTKT